MKNLLAKLAGWYLRRFAPATNLIFNRRKNSDGSVDPITGSTPGWISGDGWYVNFPGGAQ